MDTTFKISESKEYGIILTIFDTEQADEFDDYLNENCYVFSELSFKSDRVNFYFGQVSCVEAVRDLVMKFKKDREEGE